MWTVCVIVISLSLLYQANCQTNCAATVGGELYDLTPLYKQVVKDFSIIDKNDNEYYWAPCRTVFNPACNFAYTNGSAVCQKDSSPGAFHGLGSLSSQVWSPINDLPPGSGFVLSYPQGGQPDPPPMRKSDIVVLCNKSQSGLGAFISSDENPIHDYHLKFSSAYACPNVLCSLTIGQWIATLGNDYVIESFFYENGTALFYVISETCVWDLHGLYSYDNVIFSFAPLYCNSTSGCNNCPIITANSQYLSWETCKLFTVNANVGFQPHRLIFKYVPTMENLSGRPLAAIKRRKQFY